MEDTNSQQIASKLSQAINEARRTQKKPIKKIKVNVKFRQSANLGLSTGKGTPGKRGAATGSKTGENKAAKGEQNKKDVAVENEEKPIGGRESVEEQAGEGNEGEEAGNQEGEEGEGGENQEGEEGQGGDGEEEGSEGEEDGGEEGNEAEEDGESGEGEEGQGGEGGEKKSEGKEGEEQTGEEAGEGEEKEGKKEDGKKKEGVEDAEDEKIKNQATTSPADERATQNTMYAEQRESSKANGKEGNQPEVAEGEGESKPKGAEIVSEDSANLSSPFEMKGWTTEALKWAWEDKYSFFFGSYGVSLLYINFHFIMSYLASSPSFCKFGDEKSKNISIADSEFGRIIIMFLADILIIMLISALLYTGYATLPWLVRKCIENDGNWIGDACVAGAEIIPSVFK